MIDEPVKLPSSNMSICLLQDHEVLCALHSGPNIHLSSPSEVSVGKASL
jgi:hypothetical protein